MWMRIGFILFFTLPVLADSLPKYVCALDVNGDDVFQKDEIEKGRKLGAALDEYYRAIKELNEEPDEESDSPRKAPVTPQQAQQALLRAVGDANGDGAVDEADYHFFQVRYSCR